MSFEAMQSLLWTTGLRWGRVRGMAIIGRYIAVVREQNRYYSDGHGQWACQMMMANTIIKVLCPPTDKTTQVSEDHIWTLCPAAFEIITSLLGLVCHTGTL